MAAIPAPVDPTLQPTTFLRANYYPVPMHDLPLRIKQNQVVGKRPGLINQDPEDFVAASVLQLTKSERRPTTGPAAPRERGRDNHPATLRNT